MINCYLFLSCNHDLVKVIFSMVEHFQNFETKKRARENKETKPRKKEVDLIICKKAW